jgi:hypothetical protein
VPLHDRRGLRRLGFAVIAALGLHAIAASLFWAPPGPTPETLEPVTLARIESRTTPTPKPTPTPVATPTPQTSVRIALTVPATSSPAPRNAATAQPAPNAGSLRPQVRSIAHSRPIWDAPAGGSGAGSGSRTGSGGNNGSSTGGGSGGNGTGAGAQPCGFVTFSDPNGSRYDKSTGGFYVDIAMTVHFSNGGTSSVVLDYPWYYASESANPWSNRNRDDPNFPTTFQQPPPAKRDSEPPLVRYVIAHTSADGYTLLKDCPPSPSPS